MYEARTQEEILREMQGWSGSQLSNFEGTFEYDVLASNSIEFAKVEVELEQAYKAAFADTSWGEYLTMRCAELGVIRKAAVKAWGFVTVTGTGRVPEGSLFKTGAGTAFVATETVIVEESARVPVEARKAGADGIVAAGAIINIPMNIPGIRAVINEEPTQDGFDEESDAELLQRYLLKARTPATSGNKWHYVNWALSVEGVGSARCIDTWAGPNTVKVVLVDSNFREASEELCRAVYKYIETVRPVGAQVTVVSAQAKVVNITADYIGTLDEEAFLDGVGLYFRALETYMMTTTEQSSTSGFRDGYVAIARIGNLLIEKGGVEDYASLTLNGAAENIPLGGEEMPVIGEVVLHAV